MIEYARWVRAVVDWQLSTVGDPLTDIALMWPTANRSSMRDWTGLHGAWTSDRYPPPDELAECYAQSMRSSVGDWNFYRALAYFERGVITEGITHRALNSASTDKGSLSAVNATRVFIAAGLNAIAGRV